MNKVSKMLSVLMAITLLAGAPGMTSYSAFAGEGRSINAGASVGSLRLGSPAGSAVIGTAASRGIGAIGTIVTATPGALELTRSEIGVTGPAASARPSAVEEAASVGNVSASVGLQATAANMVSRVISAYKGMAGSPRAGAAPSLASQVNAGRVRFDVAASRDDIGTPVVALEGASGRMPFLPKFPVKPAPKSGTTLALDVAATVPVGLALVKHWAFLPTLVGIAFFVVPFAALNIFPSIPLAFAYAGKVTAIGMTHAGSASTTTGTFFLAWSKVSGFFPYIYQTLLAAPGHVFAQAGIFLTYYAPSLAAAAKSAIDYFSIVKWATIVDFAARAGVTYKTMGIGALVMTAIPTLDEIKGAARSRYQETGSYARGAIAGTAVFVSTPIVLLGDLAKKFRDLPIIRQIYDAFKAVWDYVRDVVWPKVKKAAEGGFTGLTAGIASAAFTPYIAATGLAVAITYGAKELVKVVTKTKTGTGIAVGMVALLASAAFFNPVALAQAIATISPVLIDGVKVSLWALATYAWIASTVLGSYYGYKDGFWNGLTQTRNHGLILWAENFVAWGWNGLFPKK